MYVTLSDTQIRYDFTISIDENLKKGHFKKSMISSMSFIQIKLIQHP